MLPCPNDADSQALGYNAPHEPPPDVDTDTLVQWILDNVPPKTLRVTIIEYLRDKEADAPAPFQNYALSLASDAGDNGLYSTFGPDIQPEWGDIARQILDQVELDNTDNDLIGDQDAYGDDTPDHDDRNPLGF